jgi:hypothetical protein
MVLELKDYIKNNYGKCKVYDPKIKNSCSCMKDGWLGLACPNWQPVEWNSFEERIEELKRNKEEE